MRLCRYELHHGVRISDSALVDAAVLSDRYIADRFLPDKAIDLVSQKDLILPMSVSDLLIISRHEGKRLCLILLLAHLAIHGGQQACGWCMYCSVLAKHACFEVHTR